MAVELTEGLTAETPILVTLDDIKAYIQPTVYANLKNIEHFMNIERAAAYMARDNGGLTLPVSIDLRPDWVILPMAWIISYLESGNLVINNDSAYAKFKQDLNMAIEMIRSKASKPTSAGSNVELSVSGLTSGELTWL